MKTIKAAISLLLFSSVSAVAADLASLKSAPVAPSVPIWTGFYAGLNAGGTWQNNSFAKLQEYPIWHNPILTATPVYMALTSFGSSITAPTNSSSGFIGGGQIGFNQQFLNNFVAGGEADIQGVIQTNPNSVGTAQHFTFTYNSPRVPGTVSASVDNAYSLSKSLNYIGTARGRLGYLITPTLLAYGTAGLAYGGVSLNTNIWQNTNPGIDDMEVAAGNHTASPLLIGWTAGGGFEWMFLNNWSAKVEYLYYDLGTYTMDSGPHKNYWQGGWPVPGMSVGDMTMWSGYNSTARFNGNIVRAGVNYHFNFASAPVVAKF